MLALTQGEKRRRGFASFVQWWRRWIHPFAFTHEQPSADRSGNKVQGAGCDPAAWPRRSSDTQLLFQCMTTLQIDRDELANEEPALLAQLQGLCSLCRSKEECLLDLAHGFDAVIWEKWREYCPNAATLSMLGALRNCGLAAQHLHTPHSVAPTAKH
jgi:hypothetical protein